MPETRSKSKESDDTRKTTPTSKPEPKPKPKPGTDPNSPKKKPEPREEQYNVDVEFPYLKPKNWDNPQFVKSVKDKEFRLLIERAFAELKKNIERKKDSERTAWEAKLNSNSNSANDYYMFHKNKRDGKAGVDVNIQKLPEPKNGVYLTGNGKNVAKWIRALKAAKPDATQKLTLRFFGPNPEKNALKFAEELMAGGLKFEELNRVVLANEDKTTEFLNKYKDVLTKISTATLTKTQQKSRKLQPA